ncbi:MAG TPA: transglutaminase-like domain-containing protein [Caulobacteraceae bacterium]
MPLHRRTLLKTLGLAVAAGPLASRAFAQSAAFAPVPGEPRTFELTTRVEIAAAKGGARVWIPSPAQDFSGWFQAHGTRFSGNATEMAERADHRSGARFVEASWTGDSASMLEVVSTFSTRDRSVDLSRPGEARPLSAAEHALYLRSTDRVPLDGIVRQTSDAITAGKTGEVEKVRAIYEWVVDHTYRDPATPGCGSCNVEAMLKTGVMGGKCADINPLFVGLVRAAGIPARDIFGVRVAPSRFGYHSLGANAAIVSKAQHCRAEVHLSGYGWVPMDPADVRKVILEEPPGHLELTADKVTAARKTLFGAWESNWLPYNAAQDVRLPSGATIPFLMYPQGEVGGQALDALDPDKFSYTLTAREIVA